MHNLCVGIAFGSFFALLIAFRIQFAIQAQKEVVSKTTAQMLTKLKRVSIATCTIAMFMSFLTH
jgi:hypothetical protein